MMTLQHKSNNDCTSSSSSSPSISKTASTATMMMELDLAKNVKRRSTGVTVSTFGAESAASASFNEPPCSAGPVKTTQQQRLSCSKEECDESDDIEQSFHTARSTRYIPGDSMVGKKGKGVAITATIPNEIDQSYHTARTRVIPGDSMVGNVSVLGNSPNEDDSSPKEEQDKATATKKSLDVRSWLLFLYTVMSVTLVAGVVYGWPALRLQLKQEGSSLTESEFGAIFTSASFCAKGGRMMFGLARDRFGTRTVALITLMCTFGGALGIAFSSKDNVVALGVSTSLLSLGTGLQLVLQPVGGLFPNHNNAVVSTLSGAFQLSALVLLALAALARTSPTLSKVHVYTGYALLVAILSIMAYWILPKGSSFVLEDDNKEAQDVLVVVNEEKDNDIEANTQDESSTTKKPTVSSQSSSNSDDFEPDGRHTKDNNVVGDAAIHTVVSKEEEQKQHEHPCTETTMTTNDTTTTTPLSSKEQICSLEYISLLIWFSISLIPLQYYLGSIGLQLEQKAAHQDESGYYTYLFSVIYSVSAFAAPLGGVLADRYGLGVAHGCATLLSSISFFILSSNTIPLQGQVVGLVSYSIGRLLTFSMFFSNVGKRFGYKNFGTLTGFGLLISAILSTIQFPLINTTASSPQKAMLVNILSGVALMSLMPYCYWLYLTETKKPNGATTLLLQRRSTELNNKTTSLSSEVDTDDIIVKQ